METIIEAKQFIDDNIEEAGCRCPCCDSFLKMYRRKISSSSARALITLASHQKWVDYKTVYATKNGIVGDFSKLRYWGVVENMPEVDLNADKRGSGLWRITQKGMDFVMNKIPLPKYVFLYQGKLKGFGSDLCKIKDCLGEKWSYSEIMQAANLKEII